ncbi:enoyl-CoA hydratase/isomerase family protein [Saccharothrix hoggarensis]|uniref:Enoyl-CoA hydratase/isomerase family protein n=1 Tax=Saccharothrix hoggarensis TaxID=913853 RepID=A0ABW3QZI9_9PSEU
MTVSLEDSGGIAVIRIDEPSDAVLPDVRALSPAVAEARAAVLLVGPGLCGSDIKQLVRTPAAEREAQSASLRRVRDELANLPVPVVAAIGGSASGGAAELAMACDLRVLAAEGGLGRVTDDRVTCRGVICGEVVCGEATGGAGTGDVGTCGEAAGVRVLVARRVTAEEALRLGLVDRVVPSSAVLRTALELANQCKSAQVQRKSCRIVAP